MSNLPIILFILVATIALVAVALRARASRGQRGINRLVAAIAFAFAASGIVGAGLMWHVSNDALAAAQDYRSAPQCIGAAGPRCRSELQVRVVKTRTVPARTTTRYLTLRLPDGSTPELMIVGSPDLFAELRANQPVEAEVWTGHVVLVRFADGRTLETEFGPQHLAEQDFGWAILSGMFSLLVGFVTLGVVLERRQRAQRRVVRQGVSVRFVISRPG
jgi:hypothetical protein